MPNRLARWLLCATLLLPGPADAATSGPKTLFDHAAGAWGVGTMRLGKPLKFREGKLLVFPSQFADLLWAPVGKPRNLMLVYEVPSDEADKPFFGDKDEFFAPIRLLPEQSYWRDNLPSTPRHEVAGGRRYVFRGEEIAEAKKALGPFLEASGIKGKERRSAEAAAASQNAASSRIRVTPEPSAAAERASLLTALAAAKVTGLKPAFQAVAAKEDAPGAAALAALAALGETVPTPRLVQLSRSASVEVRAYAAVELGSRASTDAEAEARAAEILTAPAEAEPVRAAAAEGLGKAGGDKATNLLLAGVRRGDQASRPSGGALAAIGGDEMVAALTRILREERGTAAAAAAYGLARIPDCSACAKVLLEQHDSHPDPGVQQLISTLMELPPEHKH